mmetsp:Transcript_107287/g.311710  ORF Transcript_107287/g.311710 Transcript_107287/m.311710 type:complete len:155 (+) Transcript_107287:186-650(+)
MPPLVTPHLRTLPTSQPTTPPPFPRTTALPPSRPTEHGTTSGGDAAETFGPGFGDQPDTDPVRGNLRNIPRLPANKVKKVQTKKGYKLPSAMLSVGDALIFPTGPGRRGLKRVFLGITWKGTFEGKKVDLDLTVAPFSCGRRSVEDTVFYKKVD